MCGAVGHYYTSQRGLPLLGTMLPFCRVADEAGPIVYHGGNCLWKKKKDREGRRGGKKPKR